jgi:hypothetical protein
MTYSVLDREWSRLPVFDLGLTKADRDALCETLARRVLGGCSMVNLDVSRYLAASLGDIISRYLTAEMRDVK